MKKVVLIASLLATTQIGVSQNFSNGLFMANEGNFGTPNGDVSFYDNASDSLYVDLFQNNNPGEDGIDVLQDFKIYGDQAFLLSKGASDNKIEIVNASDFTSSSTIDLGTAGPQSIWKVSDTKAYVSCANAPNLRILDLENEMMDGEVSSSIGSFSSQDFMAANADYAYIFMGDKLGVIAIDGDSTVAEITLDSADVSCSGMILEGDDLFVLTNSGWSGSESHLFKIDLAGDSVLYSVDLTPLGKARLLQSDMDDLYFMIGNQVYKMGKEDDIAPMSSFATSGYADAWDLTYGKSFYISEDLGHIYIGSAEGYVTNGSYEVLSLEDGNSLSTGHTSGGIGLSQFTGLGSVLSVSTLEEIAFSLYPNPTRNIVNVQLEKALTFEYQLMDSKGSVVQNQRVFTDRLLIDLNERPAGIYYLRILSESGVSSKKIIKQ